MSDCYEAAARLIGTKNNESSLVNGYIYSTKLHRMIKHAWVESEGKVWDYSNSRRLIHPIEEYYEKAQAKVFWKYPRLDALQMIRETKRFEFWTEQQRLSVLGDQIP